MDIWCTRFINKVSGWTFNLVVVLDHCGDASANDPHCQLYPRTPRADWLKHTHPRCPPRLPHDSGRSASLDMLKTLRIWRIAKVVLSFISTSIVTHVSSFRVVIQIAGRFRPPHPIQSLPVGSHLIHPLIPTLTGRRRPRNLVGCGSVRK